jgi:hypothetical protein
MIKDCFELEPFIVFAKQLSDTSSEELKNLNVKATKTKRNKIKESNKENEQSSINGKRRRISDESTLNSKKKRSTSSSLESSLLIPTTLLQQSDDNNNDTNSTETNQKSDRVTEWLENNNNQIHQQLDNEENKIKNQDTPKTKELPSISHFKKEFQIKQIGKLYFYKLKIQY